jgi:hypothetical protein
MPLVLTVPYLWARVPRTPVVSLLISYCFRTKVNVKCYGSQQ